MLLLLYIRNVALAGQFAKCVTGELAGMVDPLWSYDTTSDAISYLGEQILIIYDTVKIYKEIHYIHTVRAFELC